MSNNEHKNDEWEDKLEAELVILKNCQNSNNLNSCTPCDKFFECEIRKTYIKAVYESMNKGSKGGFEF